MLPKSSPLRGSQGRENQQLPPPWTVVVQDQELVFRGPQTVFTQCGHGADASQFSCENVRGSARYFVRASLRSAFERPFVPQSSVHMAGKMPWLRDSCFYYFFRHEAGVRAYEQVKLKASDLAAVVAKVTGGTRVQLSCPGY